MEPTDRALLDRYLSGRDEAAFATLVRRYLDFVHGVALRVTGNEELSRDVAQATFIRLAQRAALIPPGLALASWLHRIARGLAVDLIRVESRRKSRELGSTLMPPTAMDPIPEPDWSALAPVVDALVERLPAADRDVLLLRYYRNESHASIAARLGLTEGAARKRALRALQKLRLLLAKRGIATSAAALATLLPAHASPAAPGILATTVLQATQGVAPIVPHFLNSTLLAVTTAQKAALAASLLLLFSATCYSLASGPGAAPTAATPPLSTPGSSTSSKVDPIRTHAARAVPASAEERLARLREIVAIPRQNPRSAELIAYLDGLPPDLFPETLSTLLEIMPRWGHDIIREEEVELLRYVVCGWAKIDPPAAFAYVAILNGKVPGFPTRLDGEIMLSWAARDLHAAADWFFEQPPQPFIQGVRLYNLLACAAASSPEEAMQILNRVQEPELRDWALKELVTTSRSNPKLQEQLLACASPEQADRMIGAIATGSPDRALGLLKEHPGAAAHADLGSIYQSLSYQNSSGACESLATLPPGPGRKQAATGILNVIAINDPIKALDLMQAYPEAVTPDHVQSLARRLSSVDPATALEKIPHLTDSLDRGYLTTTVLKTWLSADSPAARQWLANHPQPAEILQNLPGTP